MKLLVLANLLIVAIASPALELQSLSKQHEKRGLPFLSIDGGHGHGVTIGRGREIFSGGFGGGHLVSGYGSNAGLGRDFIKSITITKEVGVPVPHPVPVQVVKNVGVPVPHPVPYPVEKRYPVPVEKPYPVAVEKPVPYPVEQKVPYPVHVPVKVQVPHPVPVHVPKPVAVPVSVPVKVPIPQPYPVYKQVPVVIKSHGYEGAGFGGGLGGFGGYSGRQVTIKGNAFSNSHGTSGGLGSKNFAGNVINGLLPRSAHSVFHGNSLEHGVDIHGQD